MDHLSGLVFRRPQATLTADLWSIFAPPFSLSYGGALFLLFFPVFFSFGAGDLASSGLAAQVVAVGFVSLSWLPFGVTLAAVVGRLDRRW